jgi:hypothetical protein
LMVLRFSELFYWFVSLYFKINQFENHSECIQISCPISNPEI